MKINGKTEVKKMMEKEERKEGATEDINKEHVQNIIQVEKTEERR